MAFTKKAEAQILSSEQYPVATYLHSPMMERILADPQIIARFEKVASELKAVAPKAKDFLYFSAVMMHAAEAALVNNDGSLKKNAQGDVVTSSWDKSNDTWKWVCSDPKIMPYKNANCFVPGTHILMSDGTVKNIEDVEVGDEVITHLGNKKKVLNTTYRYFSGKLLNIGVRNELSLQVTDEHPFYQLKIDHPVGSNDTQKHLLRQGNTNKEFKFTQAGQLNKYDILTTPVVKCDAPNEFTNGQARLLGLFAAEGSFGKKYNKDQCVIFTFNINELETLALETKLLLETEFSGLSVKIYSQLDKNTSSVTATGPGICDFFRRHVGEYSQFKTLSPNILFNENDEIRKNFIIGWLDGDGCVEKEYGQLIGVTVSANLASQIRMMLNSLGIHSSIRFCKRDDVKVINSNYGEYSCSDIYRIEIPSTYAKSLIKDSSRLQFVNKPKEKWQNVFYNNYHVKSISSIENICYDGLVYNFEVDGDNSYIANNIAVHNCDIFPEEELLKAHKQWIGRPLCLDHKSSSVDFIRGVVVDTYYDFPKKRVIALCALDKLNYPDLARKIESKYATCVSMGTAVGRAICSDCGKVARVSEDFCEHMRHKSCYGEINIDLKPIELSIVVNGADPNAQIKHIIAAADSLAEYTSLKEKQIFKLSMHEMVDPNVISTIKKDLESIMQKLEGLEDSAKKVEEIEEKEEKNEFPQENEADSDKDNESNASYDGKLNVKLAGVLGDLHSKLDKLQGDMNKLQRNGEDTMTTKQADLKSEAYFQGGGGDNEPTPGKPKYEKEDSDSIRAKGDKQMNGASPFPGVGSPEGLYGDDLKKKELVLRAEKEERALRRQAAVDRAKEALKSEAYFQGGGDVNEPTPGKPKYEKENSDSIRDKEDKQMVGQPPFPGVGDVEGLHPSPASADQKDELKRKQMLSRAHLKGRFVKAANPDGSENRGESRWHIFADDKIVLTATVDELTNGRTNILYDSVANKEFGKKMLGILRTNDFDKAKVLLKGAQAAPPAELMGAPAPVAEAPAMPSMDAGEPRDAGGTGDPKEELPALLTTAENTLADIRAAVEALLEESKSGLEGFEELSEDMEAEAAQAVGLHKLSNKVCKAMLVGMKSAEHELSESINELKMAKHVSENRDKVRDDQKAYVSTLIADACEDTKKVLTSCVGLMKTFVKYADGTKAVEARMAFIKQAQNSKPGESYKEWYDREGWYYDPMDASGRQAAGDPPPPSAGGGGYKQPGTEVAGIPATDAELEKAKHKALQYDPFAETQKKKLNMGKGAPAIGVSTPESQTGGTAGKPTKIPTMKSAPSVKHAPGWQADDGGEQLDLDVELPGGTTLKNVAAQADDLTTKEGRAAARDKIAAKAMKWNPVLNEAHSGGVTTQLDVKPTGDLAKVETLEEANAKMMDVALAPPRIRQAAEEIQKLVALGHINPDKDFDELIAQGLDKDAVNYWKQYFGQLKGEGSQFASELVKEYHAKKKSEADDAYRVKVARSYDLAHDMVRRGMLADDRTAINSQVNELLALSDKAFDSYKRFTEKQSMQKQASMPQVGRLTGEPNVVFPAPMAASIDLASELNDAFSGLPLKGRLF